MATEKKAPATHRCKRFKPFSGAAKVYVRDLSSACLDAAQTDNAQVHAAFSRLLRVAPAEIQRLQRGLDK